MFLAKTQSGNQYMRQHTAIDVWPLTHDSDLEPYYGAPARMPHFMKDKEWGTFPIQPWRTPHISSAKALKYERSTLGASVSRS